MLALLCCANTSQVRAAPQPYVPQATTCDGFPRLTIGMAPGYCAGLVLSPEANDFRHRLVKTPRMLLQLPDSRRWLLTDLGAWTAGRGKIWLLEVTSPQHLQIRELLGGLTMPHTVAW